MLSLKLLQVTQPTFVADHEGQGWVVTLYEVGEVKRFAEGYPPNTYDRLFVPRGAKEKYKAAEPWNYYETIKEMK